MRSRLLNAASGLFRERGLGAVSIADIASAADAFPSQITYYFRTKEALFVEAACREALYAASEAERAAGRQRTPERYTRALIESVMQGDGLGFFVEAMVLARRRQDLAPLIERTIERLHAEGLRAHVAQMSARGWQSQLDPETSARRFWAIAIGLTTEGHAVGRAPAALVADMLRLLGPQADAVPLARPGSPAPGTEAMGHTRRVGHADQGDGSGRVEGNVVRLTDAPRASVSHKHKGTRS